MDQSNQILKANENLKKVFSGILKDLQEITKGFHKLHDIQKKQMSDNIKQSVILKQERYKEKIVQKQTAIKNKKLLKYQKDKSSKHHEHGHGFLRVLGAILTFSKVLLVTLIGFGLVKLIGKTEMGKLLINLVKAIAKAFVSVVKDLSSVLIAAIKESTKYLIQAVKAIFSAIGDFFGFVAGALTGSNGYKKLNVAGLLKMFLEEVVVKAFRLVGDVLKLAAKILIKTLQENVESIKAGFVSFMTALFDTIKTIALTLIKTLYSSEGKSNLTGIYDGLKKIVLNIWDFVIKLLKTEFVNSKGETSTFGSVIGKYLLVWAGLKAGALTLTGTVLQLSGAMGAFFEEMDASMARANAMKCCCNNMANSILDVAEDIERKGKPPTSKPGSTTPTKTPSWWERTKTGIGEKVARAGEGVTNAARKVKEFPLSYWKSVEATPLYQQHMKTLSGIKSAGARFGTIVFDAFMKPINYVSEKAAKLASKVEAGWEKAKNKVKEMATKGFRFFVAIIKNNVLRNKVVKAALKTWVGRFFTKVLNFLVVAGTSILLNPVVGFFINLAGWALLAYDLYQVTVWLFTSSNGEDEDGGYIEQVKGEVDETWKEIDKERTQPNIQPPPVVTSPVVAPSASLTKPVAATTPPIVTTPVEIKSVSVPAPAPAPAPAPVSAPASAVAPAVTAAPVVPTQPLATASATAPSSPSTPSSTSGQSLDELKKQVIGGKLNNGGPRSKTVAAIIHHTGGRGLEATLQTLQNRGLSYHYLIDRDGRIVQSLPDNLVAWHAHPNDKKPGVTNANTVGIATVAKDDNDLTPEQISSAVTLEDALARKYGFPKTDVFGHGEVSSHKHPQEGATIVKAIRGGAMPSKELNIENAKIPTMSGGGYSQDSQLINQNMEQKNMEMKELRNTLLDMFSDLYQADSSGGTVINNTTLVNQSKSNISDRLFEDPNLGEKIFKHAFSY